MGRLVSQGLGLVVCAGADRPLPQCCRDRGDSLASCALLFLVFLTLELDGNEDFPASTIVAPLIALYALILVFLPVLLLVTRHYVRVSTRAVGRREDTRWVAWRRAGPVWKSLWRKFPVRCVFFRRETGLVKGRPRITIAHSC